MKDCKFCGAPNDDAASECEDCGKSEFGPVGAAARATGFQFTAPAEPEQPREEPSSPSQSSASSSSSSSTSSSASSSASGSSDSSSDNSDEKTRRFLDQIRSYASGARKRRIIFLFGFSRSGKSFYIARAKHDDTGLGFTDISPDLPSAVDDLSRLQGVRLPGTEGIEVHTMQSRNDAVVLVDIEGELFRIAAQSKFVGGDRLFLEAIAHADGFIFLIPAAETLIPGRWEHANDDLARQPKGEVFRQANERIVQLRRSIMRITKFVRFVAKARRGAKDGAAAELSAEEAVDQYVKLTEAQINDLRLDDIRSNRPALVLLSKADEYQKLCVDRAQAKHKEGWREFYDGDPMGRLADAEAVGARLLLKAFDESFKTYRVDFLTAFHGHDEFPTRRLTEKNDRYDMNLPHYGVARNFNWIKDEIDKSKKKMLSRINPGVAPAVRLRKVLDRNFAQAWGGTAE